MSRSTKQASVKCPSKTCLNLAFRVAIHDLYWIYLRLWIHNGLNGHSVQNAYNEKKEWKRDVLEG